ncbi:nucleotidyl transferase AbiEii/AbiGii toxin family protein [Dyella flagellata]|uniref:Nucleotidyl transferase AbiEii toxin, Type IV TA system n=1 Tax=Dyella flagellata TaxID=1867833 RepID=A0ABQ5XCG8_9GAMM|nr:nucleotidyl transferase AbiEii/AbiGii toxin family protein [Dyella flagellata]GLQ89152.1 hypothetical protein GCM10007898_27240 [Dyella flagellata]
MSDIELREWVSGAQTTRDLHFRQAIHTIVTAMTLDAELAEMSYMKGGILLAIRYHSPRYTTDIDFSTPTGYSQEEQEKLLGRLSKGLALASERLEYDIECRIQSAKPEPRPKPEFRVLWINLKVGIGYALRGTKDHIKLMSGQCTTAIQMDYSFDERVPTNDIFELDSDQCLRVYALTTLVAEKYRALLQQVIRRRARRQDIYDLNFLLRSFNLTSRECRTEILSALRIKAEDREVEISRDAMASQEVRERAAQEYEHLADELSEGELPDFDESFDNVRAYFESLPW